MRESRWRRARAAIALMAGMTGVVPLAACAPGNGAAVLEAEGQPASALRTQAVAPSPADDTAEQDLRAGLQELIEQVDAAHDGEVGVSVTTPEGLVSAGDVEVAKAWSTIKVPIAIAAMQKEVGTELQVEDTISYSGNEEAAALWAALGGGEQAAATVDSLLWRNGGIAHTRTTVDEYPGEATPIGFIPWSLEGQATFASRLPCIPGVETVWEAMGNIAPWQRAGLGEIDGMHFKGGWSEEEDEDYSYTYRQFGALPTEEGTLGVAIIAHPEDGSHATASEMLNDLAQGIEELIDDGLLVAPDTCVMDIEVEVETQTVTVTP